MRHHRRCLTKLHCPLSYTDRRQQNLPTTNQPASLPRSHGGTACGRRHSRTPATYALASPPPTPAPPSAAAEGLLAIAAASPPGAAHGGRLSEQRAGERCASAPPHGPCPKALAAGSAVAAAASGAAAAASPCPARPAPWSSRIADSSRCTWGVHAHSERAWVGAAQQLRAHGGASRRAAQRSPAHTRGFAHVPGRRGTPAPLRPYAPPPALRSGTRRTPAGHAALAPRSARRAARKKERPTPVSRRALWGHSIHEDPRTARRTARAHAPPTDLIARPHGRVRLGRRGAAQPAQRLQQRVGGAVSEERGGAAPRASASGARRRSCGLRGLRDHHLAVGGGPISPSERMHSPSQSQKGRRLARERRACLLPPSARPQAPFVPWGRGAVPLCAGRTSCMPASTCPAVSNSSCLPA
jgi:hypothetical protein